MARNDNNNNNKWQKVLTIANQNDDGPLHEGMAPADHVQPFLLEEPQLRGRIVRLPNVLNDILQAHAYPDAISNLLAEALCLTTLLAGMLKFDGIFTLQLKGEGVVRSVVCDITTKGDLRGMVSFDADALAEMPEEERDFLGLTVKGYLALTVDQANSVDRYQGITDLHGVSLTEAVQHYFKTSEQIKTAFAAQIEKDANGKWNGAALMLQQLALEGGSADRVDAGDEEENWRRCMILMNTLKPHEMLDLAKPLNNTLYSLFHEEGVRVFTPITIQKGCRCSAEKIRGVLDNLSVDERREYAENGVISVTCEFCNTIYQFPIENL